jgi:Protein of unknown function (DUF2442)
MNDPEIHKVEIDDTRLTFHLHDGRTVSAPLAYYPTLLRASPAERAQYVIYPFSVHWPDLDVDLDAECLLRGARELPIYAAKTAREPMVREDPPLPPGPANA